MTTKTLLITAIYAALSGGLYAAHANAPATAVRVKQTAPSSAVSASTTQAASRVRQSLDFDWRFYQIKASDAEKEELALGAGGYALSEWRTKPATGADDTSGLTGDTNSDGWTTAKNGDNVFKGRGWAWFRASLADKPGAVGPRVIRFTAVDDNAVVFLNGVKVGAHQGWSDAFDVDVTAQWKPGQTNELAVLVQNTDGAGGITGAGLQIGDVPAPPYTQAGFNDASWRKLDVPHDFVVENPFVDHGDVGHGAKELGVGWYRKTFTLPIGDKGKSVWLDFDGVYRDARVFLNGKPIGQWKSGYAPVSLDISQAANFGGKNVLVVRADARQSEGWWYEGGGIYRHVWLTVANPLHVAPSGVHVVTQMPEPKNGVVPPARVTVQTEVRNETGVAQTVVVESRAIAPGGKVAAMMRQNISLNPHSTKFATQTATVASPQLWSVETPRLYRIETRVLNGDNGAVVDNQTTPFGIRTIRFDAKTGFYLNGKHVEIKGTCNHQDFAGVGVAVPDAILDWRIKKLKQMGSNAYRTSHNPVAQELLDACDRQGMLVMDETRHLGDTFTPKTAPGTPAVALTELRALVKRDRNHPSIIIWSLANEEPLQSSKDGARIFQAMKDVTDDIDGTRPVSAAMNGGHTPDGFHSVQDLEGFNYDIGSYDNFHARYPDFPMYGSETASAVATRGEYVNDTNKGYVSNYDQKGGSWAQTAQDAWKALATRPFMTGGFVWTGFDYRGEPTPYGWPCISSHFGIMDMCGFPKDPYYYYLAWWGDKPLVHIFPDWNAPGKTPGQSVSVWAYGNTATVELFLNGKSLGAKAMPPYEHVAWDVPYAPGVLEARGYDASGKQIAREKLETTGQAAALRLTPDRKNLIANNQDATVVEVSVVDAQGRIVPDANPQITFAVSGAGKNLGVGNGDPSSHESDKANTRRAFHGRALLVLGATQTAGAIEVTATAPGLKPATAKLSAK